MHKVNVMPCDGLKSSVMNKRQNFCQNWKRSSATLLIAVLMLSGCASSSTSSKAVVVQPLSSAIVEPQDASSFYQRLTSWRESVKAYLETEMQGSGH